LKLEQAVAEKELKDKENQKMRDSLNKIVNMMDSMKRGI
jgi:Asp-tRNA(Asn)/Glu-tRNA(Gln) amidotransferase C subunit